MPLSADTRLLELIGEIQGLLDLGELRAALLVALDRAVPSDWISMNEMGRGGALEYAVSNPPVPDELVAAFAQHTHEHPLIARFAQTSDTRPYRLSDVLSRGAFRSLPIYDAFYRELGIEFQIAFVVKVSTTSQVAIALSRSDRDYDDGERLLLDRARPYLIQIYGNAIAHTRLRERRQPTETALASGLIDSGLTAGEAAVLARVARGQSNRDVAATLAISERTVGKHLQRCYRKLGASDRSQAAARAWASWEGCTPRSEQP